MPSFKINNQFIVNNLIPDILLFLLLFSYAYLLFPDDTWILKLNISLSTLIFALCLLKINKWIFRLFLISISLLTAIYYPILEFFGPVSPSSMEAMMATDFAETSSYINILPVNLYIKAFLILLMGILVSFMNFWFFRNKISIGILVLFFGLAFTKRLFFSDQNYYRPLEGSFNIIPAKVLEKIPYFYSVALKGLNYQAQLLREKDNWQIDSSKIEKELYIMIIGESVRHDVFSNNKLFDPQPLDTIPKINFENAISYANNTLASLRSAFVFNGKGEAGERFFPNNIVNLAKKAGMHTEWLSNQATVGEFENYTSALARCADYSQFINNTNLKSYSQRGPDSALVTLLKQRLSESTNKKNLFFLHTYGSHPSACATTGGAYDKFFISDEVSCYIKTVSNVKKLIYDVYQFAKKNATTFKIMYVSDHGLTYDSEHKVLKHAYGKQNFTIPLFILADDLSQNLDIKASRNIGDFFNLFQEFTGIHAKRVMYDYRFISEEHQKNWDQLADGLNFNQLKDNAIPLP